MHEMGLARRIVELAGEELSSRNIDAPAIQVVVRIGPMSGIAGGSLAFYFDLVKERDSRTRDASLVIKRSSLRGSCPGCGDRRELEGVDFRCPQCGAALEIEGAEDLMLESINTA